MTSTLVSDRLSRATLPMMEQ
ncbi:Protein of unknown function [Escherichia coli D6-117.29]|nr:Protein of unknown function [Escherichia coli D6-113.11]CDP74818.1 Protein of unknown function [Escherichia coli D6-117.29]CDU32940.1 Protein of unknown function [Escherichia coli D6-113.11]